MNPPPAAVGSQQGLQGAQSHWACWCWWLVQEVVRYLPKMRRSKLTPFIRIKMLVHHLPYF